MARNSDSDAILSVSTDYLAKDSDIVLVYSGNGSQWSTMGAKLYKTSPEFRASIENVASIFDKYEYGFNLINIINDTNNNYDLTEIAQPALFAIQVAITDVLVSKGMQISAVIGHSVGEISAAWASGALSLEDAVKVVYVRSLAQATTKGLGRMAAVSSISL